MITQPYVPVLRVLRAEMRALSRCDQEVRRNLCPWFRIVRTRSPESLEKFLGRSVANIAQVWALSGRAFVELAELPTTADKALDDVEILTLLHESLRERGIVAQPVLPTHAKPEVRAAALALSRRIGTRLAIRVFPDDLEDPFHLVRSIQTFCGPQTRMSELDVLLDLERIPPHSLTVRDQVLGVVGQLDVGQDSPNSITLIGSSLPEDYAGIPRNSIREVIKFERQLWRYILRTHSGDRIGIGDHVVVRTTYVDQKGPFPNINGKILYSTANRWIVCRGTSRQEEALHVQHLKLAQMLTESVYFANEATSWGDAQLVRLARGQMRTGSPRDMLEICASHHLSHMANETRRELALG